MNQETSYHFVNKPVCWRIYVITNVFFDDETGERGENIFTCDDENQVPNYIYCYDEVDELPGPGVDYTIVDERVFTFCEGDDITPGDYKLIKKSTKILI